MRALSLMCSLAIAGCTAVSGRNDPPDVQFVSTKSLDDAVACVISYMTANNYLDVAFFGRIVVPNKVYEVHPGTEIMTGGEPIFLRVESAEAGTKVAGYSVATFSRNFNGLQDHCS